MSEINDAMGDDSVLSVDMSRADEFNTLAVEVTGHLQAGRQELLPHGVIALLYYHAGFVSSPRINARRREIFGFLQTDVYNPTTARYIGSLLSELVTETENFTFDFRFAEIQAEERWQ